MSSRPRSAIFAVCLHLAAPGCGHLYLGHARRFLIPALAVVALYTSLGLGGLLPVFAWYAAALVALSVVFIFGLLDTAVVARRDPYPERRWYMRWYVYVMFAALSAAMAIALAAIRSPVFGVETFRVPGASMVPTIRPGEYVLVDTKAFSSAAPAAGDVVVVRSPENGQLYVRRIVGAGAAPGTREVRADDPRQGKGSAHWGPIPLADIVAKVTYVFYSAETGRIGMRVN